MFDAIIAAVHHLYPDQAEIPLHEPVLGALEKNYLNDVIDSGFVSSAGAAIGQFEKAISDFTGIPHVVATVNGTSALLLALKIAGVNPGDLVITQSASFIATANAISHCGAEPLFLDIEATTLGLSTQSLTHFLDTKTERRNGHLVLTTTGQRIAACIPMHTFGLAADIQAIVTLCDQHQLPVIEDAAEALGSFVGGQHLGGFGQSGILSFNGNKIITTGGGGALVTHNEELATLARHLSTTAKIAHPWQSQHDQVGYNFRMPNLNAALGLAQMERLPEFLRQKRALAHSYHQQLAKCGLQLFKERDNCRSNYWLNAVAFESGAERDNFLKQANELGIQARALWQPLHQSPPYQHCTHEALDNTLSIEQRLVNLPSGIPGQWR